MENENFMSLYDFLGHAAGTELGKEVAAEAKKQGKKFLIPSDVLFGLEFLNNFLDVTFFINSQTPTETQTYTKLQLTIFNQA